MDMESDYAMTGAAPNDIEREYLFGPFRFVPARQRLACGDTPVRLGSRALDILAVLTERARDVVTKRELIARAWPRSVVEDSNLKVRLSALRRALDQGQRACGELATDYVATVTGRGYRFVAPVSMAPHVPQPQYQPQRVGVPMHNLPAAGTRAIGRADAVSSLLGALGQRRTVSVVAPGGIGKTTAIELAARLDERYHLLARGRHTLLRRHRILAAALDWRYEFLPEDERLILRALSVFAGPFTLDAATMLLAGGALASSQVVDGVANLVEKSLLAADPHGAVLLYRLFCATRAYALDKLEAEGEAPEMRHHLARLQSALDGRADAGPGSGAPLLSRVGGVAGSIAGNIACRAPRIVLRANDGIAVPGTTP